MQQNLQKYQEDATLLLEGGFIASNNADEDTAVKLFKAAALLKPESLMPKIGFGYIHILKLELKQACTVLGEVVQKEPNNEMAKALLGLAQALSPTGLAQGEKLLKELLASVKEPSVKSMTETALAFVEKFVKKNETPMATVASSAPKKEKSK